MRYPDSYLGAPVRSLQAMLAVLARAEENQPGVLPDGIYGPETAAAVRAVQRKTGLPETGRADVNTWNQVVDRFSQVRHLVLPAQPLQLVWQPLDAIRPGDRHHNLYPVQSLFLALSQRLTDVPALTVTGIHDAASVEAVLWLQNRSDLPEDGSITQIEWRHLVKLYQALVPVL